MSPYREPSVLPKEPELPVPVRPAPRHYPIGFFMTLFEVRDFLVRAHVLRVVATIAFPFIVIACVALCCSQER